MNVFGHSIISLSIGSLLYSQTRSFFGFICVLIAGIFIDLDHYIDFAIEKGITFDFVKVYKAYGLKEKECMHFKRMFLIFHSYEILVLLSAFILILNLDVTWKYIAISFAFHLFTDQALNPISPLTYFLSYRLANNFNTKKMFLNREVFYAFKD